MYILLGAPIYREPPRSNNRRPRRRCRAGCRAYSGVAAGVRIDDWFLTAAERGNPATGLDARRGGIAWPATRSGRSSTERPTSPAFALATWQPYGAWGGTSPEERTVLRKKARTAGLTDAAMVS